MKVLLGSTSSKKIEAVKIGFKYYNLDLDLESYKVPSMVSENPINEETLQGARNRNNNLVLLNKPFDILLSIEAGFTKENDDYYIDTYCSLFYKETEYIGKSPRLKISSEIFNYIKLGNALHELVQTIQNTTNDDGVIGYLSNGKLKRSEIEAIAVEDALSQVFKLNRKPTIIDIDKYIIKENVNTLNRVIRGE